MVPPGTPKDRLNVLRKAFRSVMEDPKFLAEAKNSKLNVKHVTWQQIEKTIKKLFSMSPQMIESLEFIAGIKRKKP
jgi:tripartite-type tricarboxylate transporter receptor subunit TctC